MTSQFDEASIRALGEPRSTAVGGRGVIRCAVYTRKSSEEGLDMAFNSLDAQREAGSDYIKSQKHQGWTLVPGQYDDGGYSGGTTDRPGLQKLLSDIQRGKVDVVVVYKVDRLSRSLADFARLMQTFDEHQVSFVSVTQQFNTTTSMGRLTLNMLLSFAQFEREVAGERIRDKIAATKRKGVWVGGQPPLGYRLPGPGDPGYPPGDRVLRIVEPEANLVRAIYAGYLERGSLVELAARLNKAGHSTKRWVSSHRNRHGGNPLTAAFLYRVLTNPIYTGHITHAPGSGKPGLGTQARSNVHVFLGKHKGIIDQATWNRVRAKMKVIERDTQQRWTHTHLLKGKLRTFEGHAMSPSSVIRPGTKRKGVDAPKRRVRYYVSQKGLKHGFAACPIKRVPAGFIDDLVRAVVFEYLGEQRRMTPHAAEPSEQDRWLRQIVSSVTVGPDELSIDLLEAELNRCSRTTRGVVHSRPSLDRQTSRVPRYPIKPIAESRLGVRRLVVPIQHHRRRGRRFLVAGNGTDLRQTVGFDESPKDKEHMIHAIGEAFAWHRQLLRTNETVDAFAERHAVADSWVHSVLRLTQLSPALIRSALCGGLARNATLSDLRHVAQQLDWSKQASRLGPE